MASSNSVPISRNTTGAALLLIEFQREWLDPEAGKLGHLMHDAAQFAAAQANSRLMLAAARQVGLPVVHVPCLFAAGYPELGGGKPHGLFQAIPRAATWTAAGQPFAAGFEPAPAEFVVSGRVGASAFAHSNLDVYLRNNGIGRLFLAGFALHVCVESTLRQGHDLGYDVAIVTDATAAFTAEQRRYVLAHVAPHFGWQLTATQFCEHLAAASAAVAH